MRLGNDAVAWARGHSEGPPPGLGASDGTWYRMCLQYVRASFGLPGGTPDAGKAWDWAERQHHVKTGAEVPRGVPVFWELPSVADHVAMSAGDGWCWSTDAARRGKANKVRIDAITTAWGGRLLGWTEDLNGQRIWTPPKTARPTPNITAALQAKTWPEREAALHRVVAHGSPKAKVAAQQWLAARATRVAARKAASAAREALKAQER